MRLRKARRRPLACLSLLGGLGERKPLVFQGWAGRGLYYIAAAIFAGVIFGGAWGGSCQPSWVKSSC